MSDTNAFIGAWLSRLSIFLLFVSGIINTIDKINALQIPMLFMSVALALIYMIIKGKVTTISIKHYFFPYLCLVTGIFSSVIVGEVSLAINSMAMFIVFFVFANLYSSNYYLTDIDKVVFVLFVMVVIASVIIRPIKLSSYSGVFYNSNSLGDICCSFFTYFLATIRDNPKTVKQKIGFCLLSFGGIAISSSRGAFVVGVFIFLLWVYLELKKKGYFNFDNKKKKKIAILLLIIVAICLFTPLYDVIFNSIIVKFINKSSNVTAGRSDIWLTAWEERTLFGHGRMYFSGYKYTVNGTYVRFGAHNTIVSILGQYGLAGAVSYMGLFIYFFVSSYKNYKKTKSSNFFLMAVSFLSMSLFEGMLMKLSMFIMYYGLAYSFQVKNDVLLSNELC